MSSSQQYQEGTWRKRKISHRMASKPNSIARYSDSSIDTDEPVLRSISLLQSDSVIIPSSDSFSKQAPTQTTKKPASWDVSVIPGIPLFYPLEQTRVSIPSRESSPTEIAKRIVKCLEDLSIAATYNKDQVRMVFVLSFFRSIALLPIFIFLKQRFPYFALSLNRIRHWL
jgi:hypothetical protein